MQANVPVRRRIERQHCVIEARAFVEGHPAIFCSIRDITPEGAKLMIREPMPVSSGKILVLIPSISEVWAARIRWKRPQSIGVEFIIGEADLGAPHATSDPTVFALRVQMAEIARSTKRAPAAKTG